MPRAGRKIALQTATYFDMSVCGRSADSQDPVVVVARLDSDQHSQQQQEKSRCPAAAVEAAHADIRSSQRGSLDQELEIEKFMLSAFSAA